MLVAWIFARAGATKDTNTFEPTTTAATTTATTQLHRLFLLINFHNNEKLF
jgi:hypothetical protein